MATATDYLKLRGRTWYVRVQLPSRLWLQAGTREYVRSLRTGDLREAEKRKHAIIAAFKRRIASLQHDGPAWFDDVTLKAMGFRDAIRKNGDEVLVYETDPEGRQQPFRLRDELHTQITDEARQLLETHGDAVATSFFKLARGEGSLLREMVDPWLQEQTVTGQTSAQHRVAVTKFLDWAGRNVLIEDVGRKKAGEFVSFLLSAASHISRATAKRYVSSLSSLWKWLDARGHVEPDVNPWRRQNILKKPSGAQQRRRKQWDDASLVALLSGSYTNQYNVVLHDLIRLALATGARLNELCSLKKGDVEQRTDGWWITVRAGKTDAAIRSIPIHSSVEHILRRRIGGPGEYLFDELVPGGPDNKRSWYVTKAFGRYADSLKLGEKRQVFHALRNTFIEAMEGADVPENVTKLLVGHSRDSLTYGHYSKGERLKLREQINRLHYSKPVMQLLREPGAKQAKGSNR